MFATNTIDQDTTKTTKRKSVALTADEKKALRQYTKKFQSVTEAADDIGVSRQVLFRVLLAGSGSQEKIEIIRAALTNAE